MTHGYWLAKASVEDLVVVGVDCSLAGRSLRHNCVQIFNIISCFISDLARKIIRKKARKKGDSGTLGQASPIAISKLASF